jgi:transcriptional regulator with XRE-family HTH domain
MVSVFATNGVDVESEQQDAPEAPTWGSVGPPPELWREPDEIVAANVRRVRKLRGLSGRELEERAGLRGRYVSDLERGRLKGGPSVSDVVRMALALSVSPLALVVPWHEGEDEAHVMYVGQGTFGLLFPGGTAGVMAAARLWSGRVDPTFAPYVNVHEYTTTLPHGYTESDESVRVPNYLGAGPATIRELDGRRVAFLEDGRGTVLPLDVTTGEEWDGTELDETPLAGTPAAKVELLEQGPLFERLPPERESAGDDEGGRS